MEGNVLNIITGNLTITSVNVNNPSSSSCFNFVDLITKTSIGNKIMVQNDSGVIFPAQADENNLYLSRDQTSNFFRIYSSEEFPSVSAVPCASPLPLTEGIHSNTYTLGLSKTVPYIFESKILELFGNYSANYTAVKEEVGIFPEDEFGLQFTYNNNTVIRTAATNKTVSIYADKIPIQYVNATSGIESGFIEVDVW